MSLAPRPPLPLPDAPPLAPPAGFIEACAGVGAQIDPGVAASLGAYLARLLAMNEHVNLTAVRDPLEAWQRHVLDSLTIVPFIADLPAGASLVDVGSGGGLPGVPLAIARPDLRVVLVESTQKKAAFLDAVTVALGLANVTVRAERAEQLAVGGRSRHDVVTARAVAKIAELLPLVVPLVRPGGRVLLIKGQRAAAELDEARGVLRKLGVSHEATRPTPTGCIVALRAGVQRARR